MIDMKEKYPRFFLSTSAHPDVKYITLRKKDQIYIVYKTGINNFHVSYWDNKDCEQKLKSGWWREIPIEEASLL